MHFMYHRSSHRTLLSFRDIKESGMVIDGVASALVATPLVVAVLVVALQSRRMEEDSVIALSLCFPVATCW